MDCAKLIGQGAWDAVALRAVAHFRWLHPGAGQEVVAAVAYSVRTLYAVLRRHITGPVRPWEGVHDNGD
jgi:hypothetical protein